MFHQVINLKYWILKKCHLHYYMGTDNYIISSKHFSGVMVRPKKKNMCVSGRPTDPKILQSSLTFFMPKKKIDRQNPEIRFRLQQFSSFSCTFDRCLEPKTLYCMSNN